MLGFKLNHVCERGPSECPGKRSPPDRHRRGFLNSCKYLRTASRFYHMAYCGLLYVSQNSRSLPTRVVGSAFSFIRYRNDMTNVKVVQQLINLITPENVEWHTSHHWIKSRKKHVTLQWRHNECDGVSTHQPHDCLPNRLFKHRWKKASKLHVNGLCEGNSTVTGEFPAQRASNAENVSIWWRNHETCAIFGCRWFSFIQLQYTPRIIHTIRSCCVFFLDFTHVL